MPKSKPLDTRSQIDMFPAKRGRGRPRKPDALSNAERQRRYRQKSVTVRTSVLEAALATSSFDNVNYDVIGQLQAENDALHARVAELEAELRNVTKKGS